ncbi:hypothetical protein BB8028_0002g08650 [Beauveria bassiana]|uniref:Uncharacterized protein n=3 Tax=Beauveria bassiana TaxID=176275 RepID=J4UU21_BEAB2|nr:uncharacterized protein BBA_01372 [Beauveria bassiana ARSEF 2860]EJP69407.1 hypothetical protein BBA_01372 [Beauveria bassiana ARSEF 2860]KGQ10736.1 hypothetical protein BBAD15_g3922 [Beauveria bassiana D1-5]PQK10544.1 hypothetical protein BB8028_0002g08650 [Beauveria bassiana]
MDFTFKPTMPTTTSSHMDNHLHLTLGGLISPRLDHCICGSTPAGRHACLQPACCAASKLFPVGCRRLAVSCPAYLVICPPRPPPQPDMGLFPSVMFTDNGPSTRHPISRLSCWARKYLLIVMGSSLNWPML